MRRCSVLLSVRADLWVISPSHFSRIVCSHSDTHNHNLSTCSPGYPSLSLSPRLPFSSLFCLPKSTITNCLPSRTASCSFLFRFCPSITRFALLVEDGRLSPVRKLIAFPGARSSNAPTELRSEIVISLSFGARSLDLANLSKPIESPSRKGKEASTSGRDLPVQDVPLLPSKVHLSFSAPRLPSSASQPPPPCKSMMLSTMTFI